MLQQNDELRRRILRMPNATGLDVIAFDQLGDAGRFREIADLNGIDIFEQITSGKQIQIPNKDELVQIAVGAIGKTLSQYINEKLDLSKLKNNSQYPWQVIEWLL